MRRSRMRASELQFRCVGTVVGAFLFATLLTLSLHSPSPDADVFSNDQHHAPVVEDGECAGFGRSSPLLPAPSGTLSLFSLGDWGVRGLSVGSDAQMAVARGMKCAARAAPVSAVFTLGDNFYGNGVASADDPQFEFKWASVYTDAALDVPWYPALGDHDQCGDVNAQVRFSERHERWRMPSAYYEETFAFENGSAQFVFVDWVRLEGAFSRSPEDRRFGERLREDQAGEVTSEEHWEWLRRTLGKGDPTWRVVVGHRPIISVSARTARDDAAFPAEKKTRNALREAMETFGVDLWINGHDHTVQVACSETPKGATHFVTAGVGGYDLHELSPSAEWPEETAFADASFHGFAAHRFTADAITTHFLDALSNVRHSFVIGKRSKTCPGRGGSTKANVDDNVAGGAL